MQKISALSFKDLKQRISLEQVLRHYNLFDGLQLKGKSHRGPCPFCEAEGSPFSVSIEKNCYQCFACKTSGNILDFVIKWEGVKVREAGQLLAKAFLDGKAPREPTKPLQAVQREASPAGEMKESTNYVPQAPSAEAVPSSASSNETDPATCTVLPRRNPSGSSGCSAEPTGSGGAACRRPRSATPVKVSRRSSILPCSNTGSR